MAVTSVEVNAKEGPDNQLRSIWPDVKLFVMVVLELLVRAKIAIIDPTLTNACQCLQR